jgi:hypothetical protein
MKIPYLLAVLSILSGCQPFVDAKYRAGYYHMVANEENQRWASLYPKDSVLCDRGFNCSHFGKTPGTK